MAGKIIVTDNFSRVFSGKMAETTIGVPVVVPPVLPFIEIEAVLTEEPELDAEAIEDSFEARMWALDSMLVQELKKALTGALRASVWNWEGGSRDIYDTGALAASANVTVERGRVNVKYSAPYASIVHNGGYIHPYGNQSARPVYLPPRPWIDAVLYGGGPVPRFDFNDFYARNL